MTMIKNQSKLVKLLHADRRGPLVQAAGLTRCKDVGDHGVETVAFTFFVFKVTRVWKDITNVTLAAKAVTALRAELGPSGVVLTAQMEELRGRAERCSKKPRHSRQHRFQDWKCPCNRKCHIACTSGTTLLDEAYDRRVVQ